MRPGKRRALDMKKSHRLIDEIERLKASVRAKFEHAFGVIKLHFGFTKVCYRGLTKNTAWLNTLFTLSNLWVVRRKLMAVVG